MLLLGWPTEAIGGGFGGGWWRWIDGMDGLDLGVADGWCRGNERIPRWEMGAAAAAAGRIDWTGRG